MSLVSFHTTGQRNPNRSPLFFFDPTFEITTLKLDHTADTLLKFTLLKRDGSQERKDKGKVIDLDDLDKGKVIDLDKSQRTCPVEH